MNVMRKLAALLLVAALLAGVFVGCSQNDNPQSDSAASTPASEAPADSGAATVASGAADEAPAATEFVPPEVGDPATSNAKVVYTEDGITPESESMSTVVTKVGDLELDNATLQIYYWSQYYNLMNSYYAMMVGIDENVPLSEQYSFMEGQTWEQYFIESAMENFAQVGALYTEGQKAGFTMSQEDQDALEENLSTLDDQAVQYGFDTAEDLIQANFGTGVSRETYENFARVNSYASAYYRSLVDAVEYTDEDLAEYLASHADDYPGATLEYPNVNVRHILITTEDDSDDAEAETQDAEAETQDAEAETQDADAASAAAKAKAEEILAEYEKNPTEENFAALAEQYSTDPGSNTNGGLYEDVYPGQMVETFNDWCFDPARKPGDTGIVETSYGYHVMYFVGQTENYYWKDVAQSEYANDRVATAMEELMAGYPNQPSYLDVVLSKLLVKEPEAE